MASKILTNDIPAVVQEGSGWWRGEGGFSIAKPATFSLDPAKIAKARADAAEVASIMGWK